MASGESQWITGPAARRDVQHLRARSCAVVTGVGTVLADDPRLTLRAAELDDLPAFDREFLARIPPLRVVLDATLRTPPGAQVLQGGSVLLFGTESASGERRAALRAAGAEVEALAPGGDGGVDLAAVLGALAERECNEVLLECGPTLAGSALGLGLVDELWLYLAPVLLGDRARPLARLGLDTMAERLRLALRDVTPVGDDLRLVLTPPEGLRSAP
jgi:diaminohydroxyphosphoribosylaminopyrimidine deaminase/5-amino-6-(5-phosphoribosylamino)uracil reductase